MPSHGETGRNAVHLVVGGLAFLLRYLTPPEAASAACVAIFLNALVLPRLAPSLFRQEERRRPWRSGVVIYPIAVLLLILLFHRRMEVAAAAWGIMAAGDSAAGFVGRRFGRRRIPWNPSKTAEGSIAFTLAATLFSWAVLAWMGRGLSEAALLGACTSLFAAFLESLPWRLDDNLTVPLLSGVFLAVLVTAASSPDLFTLAYVCAYATAAFDTVSSEIGRAYGGRPFLITTLRRVPAGTDGAVSWLGTLAGLLAASLVCGVAAWTGFLEGGRTGIVLTAAFVGSTVDPVMGATLQAPGLIDNEAVNFSNTLVGALSGVGLATLV